METTRTIKSMRMRYGIAGLGAFLALGAFGLGVTAVQREPDTPITTGITSKVVVPPPAVVVERYRALKEQQMRARLDSEVTPPAAPAINERFRTLKYRQIERRLNEATVQTDRK